MYGQEVELVIGELIGEQVHVKVFVFGCPGDPEAVWQKRARDKVKRLVATL